MIFFDLVMFFFQYQIEDAIIVYNRLDKGTIKESLTDQNILEILRILNNVSINKNIVESIN